jgi:hypothetical protein
MRSNGREPQEVEPMPDELLIAGVVRAIGEHVLPGDDVTTERAVTAAVQAHLSGASASEACRCGRRLIERQARHPSCGHRPFASTA